MKGNFWNRQVLKSAKAKLDKRLERESLHIQGQMVLKNPAAIQAIKYGAENGTITKRRQFQVLLNTT